MNFRFTRKPQTGRASSSRSAFDLTAALAAVWLGAAILVGVLLVHERGVAIDRATRHAEALTLMLESHAARTIQTVDVSLAGVAGALRLLPQLPPNDPAFQTALAQRLRDLKPYVRTIYVLDRDGWIVEDTDFPRTPKISLADRSYFLRHRENPELVSSVSEPLLSHSGLGWFVAVSRRIGQGSEFNGIIVAAVQPKYFESMYRRMGLGEADIISLYHMSGVLISQFPEENQRTGHSFDQYPLFSKYLKQNRSGSFVTGSGLFPFESLVSYRAVESLPLVVALTERIDSVLAPWRRTVIAASAAMAGLLLLLGILVAQFRRHQQDRERVRERHSQAEKLEALGHLTGGVAHDFNNLLGVVSSSLAIIVREPLQGEQQRAAMAAAERAVVHGTQLIERLSAFARSRPMQIVHADLSQSVRTSMVMLNRAAGSDIELRTELAEDLSPCLLDVTEFEIALVNLVVNAKDAMKGAGRITIRTYDGLDGAVPAGRDGSFDDRVCLAVEDSGPGMPKEVQLRAFEPYYTTKGVRGTGFGLAQVYGFMRQIGGNARIVTQPRTGTRVELLFPKATDSGHGGASNEF